ncbi:MAG: ribulose-phosphate 3-epimerase [Clostridia bacterium]|nr:ribulose-phosphate 3-epimerase [Clostridia bacterium]
MIKFAPSILSADFLKLGEDVKSACDCGADYLHFDVMDGMFVPNISFGQCVLKAVSALSTIPCDVHLMIEGPERYIEQFAESGARVITVHAEATKHLQRLLSQIRSCGCLAGVALNPATNPEVLRYVLGDFDLALVMTVNPGFGGQKMLPAAVRKIADIRKMLDEAEVTSEIEVDGGVSLSTYKAMANNGATLLVAGSAFYGSPDRKAFGREIRKG